MRATRSAGGAGFRFFSSSLARMKASMGLVTQDGSLTAGIAGSRTVWTDQRVLRASSTVGGAAIAVTQSNAIRDAMQARGIRQMAAGDELGLRPRGIVKQYHQMHVALN